MLYAKVAFYEEVDAYNALCKNDLETAIKHIISAAEKWSMVDPELFPIWVDKFGINDSMDQNEYGKLFKRA